MQDLPNPLAKADEEGSIQTEALTNAFDVGGRRLVAGYHRRRIARRNVQQAEHEECDHRHHRDGGDDAPNDVGEHGLRRRQAVLPTPQKNGSGPLTTPLTFLRQA